MSTESGMHHQNKVTLVGDLTQFNVLWEGIAQKCFKVQQKYSCQSDKPFRRQ